MPLVNTRGHALLPYLSGAGSDGGAQADPALSLGNYRSSTLALGLGWLVYQPIRSLRIDYVSGENGTGDGLLSAVSSSSVKWTAPDGTQGSEVEIASAQQRVVEAGSVGKYVVVTRTSASDLEGTATLKLVHRINNVFGGGNYEVATGNRYRGVVFKVSPAAQVIEAKFWLDSAFTNTTHIGLELPASQPSGAFTSIPNDSTAPGGVTFVQPTSEGHADVLSAASLTSSQQVMVWIRKNLSAASADPKAQIGLRWSFRSLS